MRIEIIFKSFSLLLNRNSTSYKKPALITLVFPLHGDAFATALYLADGFGFDCDLQRIFCESFETVRADFDFDAIEAAALDVYRFAGFGCDHAFATCIGGKGAPSASRTNLGHKERKNNCGKTLTRSTV